MGKYREYLPWLYKAKGHQMLSYMYKANETFNYYLCCLRPNIV